MKFSEKVKYARMKLLLTQEALAKELGVSYATICRWEKDNREPQIVSQGKFYAFCESKGIKFYHPSPVLCTDNAAMIGSAGYYEYMAGTRSGWDLNAVPNLLLGER